MSKKIFLCMMVLSLVLSVVSFAAYGDTVAETSSEGWDLNMSSSPANNGSHRTEDVAYRGKTSVFVPVSQMETDRAIRFMLKIPDSDSNVYVEAAVYGVSDSTGDFRIFTIDTENNVEYWKTDSKKDGSWTLFSGLAKEKKASIYQAGIEYTKGENDTFDVMYVDDIIVKKMPEKMFITDIATYYGKPLCLKDVNAIGTDLSGKTEKCRNELITFSTDSPGFTIKNGNLINYGRQTKATVYADFMGVKTSFDVNYTEMYSFSVNAQNTQATVANFTDNELTVKVVTTVYDDGVLKKVYSKNLTAGKNQTVSTNIEYDIAPWYKNAVVKTFCIN